MTREDPTFFQYVLFSDKASFYNNGQFNRHNSLLIHIQSSLNSTSLEFKHLVLNCKWIFDWSILFDNRLNGETYLSFLQNKLPELLKEFDLAIRQKLWWQQDAPLHSLSIVNEYLNNIFYERWIGRYGYI